MILFSFFHSKLRRNKEEVRTKVGNRSLCLFRQERLNNVEEVVADFIIAIGRILQESNTAHTFCMTYITCLLKTILQ